MNENMCAAALRISMSAGMPRKLFNSFPVILSKEPGGSKCSGKGAELELCHLSVPPTTATRPASDSRLGSGPIRAASSSAAHKS